MSLVTELKISENIPLAVEIADYYVPTAGKKLLIRNFHAEGLFTTNSVCKLIWDYDGPNEEVLWSIRGSGSGREITIPAADVDGVKKLAVSCNNGESLSILMSVFAQVKEI